MSSQVRDRLFAIAAVVALMATPEGDSPDAQERSRAQPACISTYADDLSLVSIDARRRDEAGRYAFALRSRATYQCPYFDRDGNLRRKRENVVQHGTAFAYRRDGNITYLVTNEHVTDWPQVTTPEDRVEGIALGCKRISDRMSLVDNEADEFEADDIEVQRVLSDAELDVALVKTPVRLSLLPFRLGTSAAIRAGNAVEIRGFPLGAFSALSTGKVTNARQRDEEEGWSHTDIVVDAQLSRGQSGSPVLAVSCATRELELVGLYHAGYKEGSSINVAVGVDELREILTTLKPRKKLAGQSGPGATERTHVEAALSNPAAVPYFPFGTLTIGVRRGAGGSLLYDVFGKRFPLTDRRLLVLEDQAQPGTFGLIERGWLGAPKGMCELRLTKLDDGDRMLLLRTSSALRDQLVRSVKLRELDGSNDKSYARYEKQRALEAEVQRTEGQRRDLSRQLSDLIERVPQDSLGVCVEASALALLPPPLPTPPSPPKPDSR
jgi:serine protease Do